MLAAFVESFNPEDPIASLVIGDRPEPAVPEGWTRVEVKAASINHHDVWSLRGVGLRAEFLPMILGCDAAGVDADGREVVVHSVVNHPDWAGDEALDPSLSLLSERHDGTMCERLAVPNRNLLPKPAELTFGEAACLPTAWLTAYRMLFTKAEARRGQTVLVQGATGGLASALICLGRHAGIRMWATSRTQEGRELAASLGAEATFAPGERTPERVDAVMDSVGGPSWKHSLRSLKKGGVMVVAGGTGGYTAEAEVARVFAMNLRILGSVMGTRDEFARLLGLLAGNSLRPAIDRTIPLRDARDGFAAMLSGGLRGKVVLEP
jgi:NADPH:quinone reductase-like Zn-dependent oxidoreductase